VYLQNLRNPGTPSASATVDEEGKLISSVHDGAGDLILKGNNELLNSPMISTALPRLQGQRADAATTLVKVIFV
jgi:hypothetical protein